MLSTLLLITVLSFTVAALCFAIALIRTRLELAHVRNRLLRYSSLVSREDFEQQLDSNICLRRSELAELVDKKESLNVQIGSLQQKIRELDAKAYLQSLDAYEPQYDFISSGDYILQLESIKAQQETMKKRKKAYVCHSDWTVGESKREGKKFVNNFLDLIELAFERQCKYSIQRVKYNNVDSIEKEIFNTFRKLNRLSEVTHCEISQGYFNLKIKELRLKYELEEIRNEEQERKRELDRQIKESKQEQRISEEAKREAEEAEKREKLYEEERERIRQEMVYAVGAHLEELEQRNRELEQQLDEARIDRERAMARFNMSKAGYIYVISNIGSFENIGSLEPNIYRIFMTKNKDPDAYIRTMNPSVPFPFDIHYKVLSEDASEIITKLHQRFHDRRVNIANERREFFRVSLDEAIQAINEFEREAGNLPYPPDVAERVPQAYEYRRTRTAERKKRQNSPSNVEYSQENEIA